MGCAAARGGQHRRTRGPEQGVSLARRTSFRGIVGGWGVSELPPSSCHCRGSGGLGGELLCPKYSGGFRYRHIANEVKPPQKQEFEGVVILLRKFAKKKVPSLNVILVLLPPYTMWRYPNPPEISQDFWKK